VKGSCTNPSRVTTGVKVFLVRLRDRGFAVSYYQLVYSVVEAVFSAKVFIKCKKVVDPVDIGVVFSEPWLPKEHFIFAQVGKEEGSCFLMAVKVDFNVCSVRNAARLGSGSIGEV